MKTRMAQSAPETQFYPNKTTSSKKALMKGVPENFKKRADEKLERLLNNTTVYKDVKAVEEERNTILSFYGAARGFGQPLGEALDEEALLVKKVTQDQPLREKINKAAKQACQRIEETDPKNATTAPKMKKKEPQFSLFNTFEPLASSRYLAHCCL